jgi:hypothetical protein
VAEAVADGSYDETVKEVDKRTRGHIPKRQAENLARAAAADFEPFYQQCECKAEPRSKEEVGEEKEKFLVMSMDGKGIVMRHEDLREETQKRAEAEKHKLGKRLSKGEKRNRKRMAEVATVYDVAPHYRSAEDIIVTKETDAPRPKVPKPSNKRVLASVKRSTAEVVEEALREARRRDPEGERIWVILVDGQEDQLRQIAAATKLHKADVVIIQDFYHVTSTCGGLRGACSTKAIQPPKSGLTNILSRS